MALDARLSGCSSIDHRRHRCQLRICGSLQGCLLLAHCGVAASRGTASPLARSLGDIFQAAGTDKGYMHGYHRYYERELAPFRGMDGIRLLEIGVGSGRSLLAWSQYFLSPAALHGVDIVDVDEKRRLVCGLIADNLCPVVRIFQADQANVSAMRMLAAAEPEGWDIIIDDGSHVPAHQVMSFKSLFPALRPGGIYIIEDLTTSYQDHGQISGYPLFGGMGARYPGSAVEKFKDLVDVAMRGHFMNPEFTVFGRSIDSGVARVSFGDGILFIDKRPEGGDWDHSFPPPDKVWWQIPHFASTVQAAEVRRKAGEPMEKALEDFACRRHADPAEHAAAAAAVAARPM